MNAKKLALKSSTMEKSVEDEISKRLVIGTNITRSPYGLQNLNIHGYLVASFSVSYAYYSTVLAKIGASTKI